ncbi:DUF6493 family protein [Saccharopolyspora indica]|uniref:DUF6493 family protein n=1 Tax=Saccharopolyspora indica TaxID=1229659 RepID=UPI0022EAB9B9|nr:DUF6493 family protein [Saccharopolyspora indica]MDA3647361.1 DUF6493 family protein [Saccharopolyspora indica]
MNWDDLKELLDQGDLAAIEAAFDDAGPEERRALVKPVTEFERTVRKADFPTSRRYSAPLAVVGAAVLPMSALVPWLSRNSLDRPMRPDHRRLLRHYGTPALDHVLTVLRRRGVPWLPELADKLAQRLRPGGSPPTDLWRLITEIAGETLPDSDGYVFWWPLGIRNHVAEPRFLALVPRLFEMPHELWEGAGTWPRLLVKLAADGVLDRSMLLDGVLAALQLGVKRDGAETLITVHDELAPGLDEVAARTQDYIALLPDSYSTVAALAQRELKRLDGAGRLTTDALLDGSRAVFFRKEKKLVRAQLAWLGKVVGTRPEVLPAFVDALHHDAPDVQERALTRLLDHAGRLDAQTCADIAAVELPPDLRERAAEVFGTAEPEPLPVPVAAGRREMPPPITSVDELMAIFARSLPPEDPMVAERALAATVEFAFTDRAALRAAFTALHPGNPWYEPGLPDWDSMRVHAPWEGGEFLAVVRAATGDCQGGLTSPIPSAIPGEQEWAKRLERRVKHSRLPMLRLHEISIGLAHAPRPFLMSTPTEGSGLIDPEALAERLERAAELGFEPWPHDLALALLRLPRDAAIADRVRGSGAAGAEVAKWLDDGGLGHPEIRRAVVPVRIGPWAADYEDRTRVVVTFPDAAGPLRESFDSAATGTYSSADLARTAAPEFLPDHRDISAAHQAALFDDGARDIAAVLSALVDAHGPIGDGMNTVLALALNAREAADRACAVDAVITLTGREELQAADVGRALADLATRGEVVLGRVAQSVRDVLRAGLAGPAWELIAPLIERKLPSDGERPAPGLADLLALGVEVVGRTGSAEPVPGLPEAAARSGSSRFAKEARRLRALLP